MFRKLLLLNGLAAIGVAMYHAAAFGFDALFEWTNRYRAVTVPNYDAIGSLSYYFLVLIRQIDSYVIPSFIFVSGAFAAFALSNSQLDQKWEIVKRRITTLLFPLIIWTILRYILLGRLPSSLHDLFLTYYFLILVIQFYLLAPMIVPLAKRSWVATLGITAVITIFSDGLFFVDKYGVDFPFLETMQSFFPLWFFPRRIVWFVFGMIAYLYQQPFSEWLAQNGRRLRVLLIFLGLLTLVEYEVTAQLLGRNWMGPTFIGVSARLFAPVFILAFLSFENVAIPFSKQFELLGGKSLGIYLANIPSIYVVAVFMYHMTPWVLGLQFLYQFVLVIAGLFIPLLLMNMARKSPFRWAYRYMFG
jgi:hypothetical protein